MDHDAHLADDVDQANPTMKIVTLVVLVAAFFGVAGYIFFGPGL